MGTKLYLNHFDGNMEDIEKTGIYILYHLDTNKVYVGSTTRGFYLRLKCHLSKLKKGNHFNPQLQKDIDRFGVSGIKLKPIHFCDEKTEIEMLEEQYIQKYDSYKNGYNQTEVSNICHPNEKMRAQFSKRMKENNPMKNPETANRVARAMVDMYINDPDFNIMQFDLKGNYINTFPTIAEAARELSLDGGNISRCTRGITSSYRGYIWIKENEYSIDTLDYAIQKVTNVALKRSGKPQNKKQRNSSGVPILQFEKNGKFIKRYNSIVEASIKIGVNGSNINRACLGETKTSADFIWIYEAAFSEEVLAEKIEKTKRRKPFSKESVKKRAKKQMKKVNMLDKNTGEILNTFNSIKEAGEFVSIDHSCISRACGGEYKTSGGYSWEFV